MKIDDLNIYAKLFICDDWLEISERLNEDEVKKLAYMLKSLNICEEFNISNILDIKANMHQKYEKEFDQIYEVEFNNDELLKLMNIQISDMLSKNLMI